MTLTGYLNNYNISSLYIGTPNTFGNQTSYFYAKEIKNQLCFNEVHSANPPYIGTFNFAGTGGMIDNISVLESAEYEISFNCVINER